MEGQVQDGVSGGVVVVDARHPALQIHAVHGEKEESKLPCWGQMHVSKLDSRGQCCIANPAHTHTQAVNVYAQLRPLTR